MMVCCCHHCVSHHHHPTWKWSTTTTTTTTNTTTTTIIIRISSPLWRTVPLVVEELAAVPPHEGSSCAGAVEEGAEGVPQTVQRAQVPWLVWGQEGAHRSLLGKLARGKALRKKVEPAQTVLQTLLGRIITIIITIVIVIITAVEVVVVTIIVIVIPDTAAACADSVP